MKNNDEILFEVMENRFSCRSFKDERIKKEELDKIIKSGILAPTAVNFQPERITVVEDESLLEKLKEATRYTFDAKTIIVISYDKNVSWKRGNDKKDHGDIDASLVAANMVLMATSLNIGTCYVASFDEPKVKDILGLSDNLVVSLMIPMGYPKEFKKHNTRKNIEELVTFK